jgi:uncharacterized protein (TIGR02001 family)
MLAGLCAGGSVSAAEISANTTLATDYRFRGISQGDRSMAIQGGFDIEYESGFYAGVWASNVTFSGAAIETDLYAGYGGSINETLSYDVGYMYYAYPEDDASPDLDYQELYASLSFSDATLGLAVSNDYFAETGTFWYLYADYGLDVVENLNVSFHVAMNIFENEAKFAEFIVPADGSAGDGYLDYSVSLATEQLGAEWGLSFVGTDLKKQECFEGTKLCENTLVLSVSKSF